MAVDLNSEIRLNRSVSVRHVDFFVFFVFLFVGGVFDFFLGGGAFSVWGRVVFVGGGGGSVWGRRVVFVGGGGVFDLGGGGVFGLGAACFVC